MRFPAFITIAITLTLQAGSQIDTIKKIKSADQAYSILLKAETFADCGVGIVGQTPAEHFAVVYLVQHKAGPGYFRKLLTSQNWHTKLYALCGLYYVDNKLFQKTVSQLLDSKQSISQFSGCIINESTVGKVIFSNSPGLPRITLINYHETIDQAMARILPQSEGSYQWDISGGGIPAQIMKMGSE